MIVPHALEIGKVRDVHIATTRAVAENGWFGRERSKQLSFTTLSVSVPPNRDPGKLQPGFNNPNPLREFTIAARNDARTEAVFIDRIQDELRKRPPNEREITLFVHGYNNSFLEGAYRMAQLYHDLDLPGVPVHYSWPSAANPLGYTYDRDSVLFSRDGLEDVLRQLHRAGSRRIILVGHSLGTMLVMETLRQIEISDPGWADNALGGVVLISPDLDVELFEMQASRIATLPEPFAIFVNARDRALALSARLNGRTERLGNLTNPEALAELPVTLVDVTAFGEGGLQHFTLGSSPLLLQILGQSAELDATFQGDRAGRTGLLPGTALTVKNATQLILSPQILLRN
ncbi:alpha/beta fold hydrolase [Lutimaribacter sp. EGI FJ00015]|uniref:Alpha/beta fold hydrolase n=1 Tax=Lutimaribacter degradans TaxID=2945989 RepID=A0ACC5ZV90_9RHOB|nr:alpha/beta fold hydrolase [Lutimaribacter sp. EGI FJ00013]MCM2561987.1 alpha/beta fold hydrolase [Lutimaribacter sp. EGI FJ00013]MCO0612981.1 alpha/beta fold hydrolase [Lutimaribacter sp. EGI FJ00015]MCO0635819.1 alpha/beta fold hydrolase [Lutimaribacter sp. EGI FJ00014]